MQSPISSTIASLRRLAHDGSAMLSLLMIVGMIVGVFALLPVVTPPAQQPASPNIVTAPDVPLAKERAEEHQWLAQRNAPAVSLTQERAEEHQWLAQRSKTSAASVTSRSTGRENITERSLELHGRNLAASAASVAATQRQEELKDQWLLRR